MDIEYRNLGKAGVKVSPMVLGCMNFGGRTDENESIKIMHHALDNGINFFDTANGYQGGKSEEIVGKAIQDRRQEVVLATKVYSNQGDGPNDRGLSRRHIMLECENSLRRLDTDWIDLYQMHRPDETVPLEETLSAFNDLVRQGKIRYYGVSLYPSWKMMKMLAIARENGWDPLVSNQPRYNIIDRTIEDEVGPFCEQHGIGIINYSPLHRGILSGKYRRGAAIPENSRAHNNDMMQNALNDATFDLIETLEERAKKLGRTISQYAIAWTLQYSAITAPIVGPSSFKQWEDNLGALGWDFPQEELDFIDQYTQDLYARTPIKWRPDTRNI